MTDPKLGESKALTLTSLHDLVAERANEHIPQHTFSVDGFSFSFEARLSLALPVGSYVRLETPDGRSYLGQISSKEVLLREGPEYGVELSREEQTLLPEGVANALLRNRVLLRSVSGAGVLLARLEDATLAPTQASDLFQQADMQLADAELVSRYLALSPKGAVLDIGQALHVQGDAPVKLKAAGFNRHTFLCGQSGSGKTFALGVILEQLLLNTRLRLVILDPNSDFVSLQKLCSLEAVNRVRSKPLSEQDYQHLEQRYAELAKHIKVLRPASAGQTVGQAEKLALRFADLSVLEQATTLQLDPLADREEFNTLFNLVESLGEDYTLVDVQAALAHTYTAEARQLALRIANLNLTDWELWCQKGERPLTDVLEQDDWRCLVLDIGTLSSVVEKAVVSNALLGYLWRKRNRREPLLLVIDEAHNICPQNPASELEAIATEHAARIAGEGRKFGLYLLVATQRPGKIHGNVLSQCDNLVLMRMNSAADLKHLSNLLSQVPESLLEQALHFRQGESLIAGRLVQNPTLARFGGRLSVEGGSDIPTNWAQ